MTFRYVAAVQECTRKMVRMLPETVRKGEFRRKAMTPMADGRPRWEFPTTFLMEHPAGFWQSIAVPRLEEKVSMNTWKTFLGMKPKRPTAGGNEEWDIALLANAPTTRIHDTEYPAAQPLTEAEQEERRNHRPKSLVDGRFLCWDFASHAGCRCPADSCPLGEHEVIKMKGLRPLIMMQLARRGVIWLGRKYSRRTRTVTSKP